MKFSRLRGMSVSEPGFYNIYRRPGSSDFFQMEFLAKRGVIFREDEFHLQFFGNGIKSTEISVDGYGGN